MTEAARREEAMRRGRFAAFYHALTAVGLWPSPVAEDTWWVQWSYQGVHLWTLDPENRTDHAIILS
jgi:hypothetical protein